MNRICVLAAAVSCLAGCFVFDNSFDTSSALSAEPTSGVPPTIGLPNAFSYPPAFLAPVLIGTGSPTYLTTTGDVSQWIRVIVTPTDGTGVVSGSPVASPPVFVAS